MRCLCCPVARVELAVRRRARSPRIASTAIIDIRLKLTCGAPCSDEAPLLRATPFMTSPRPRLPVAPSPGCRAGSASRNVVKHVRDGGHRDAPRNATSAIDTRAFALSTTVLPDPIDQVGAQSLLPGRGCARQPSLPNRLTKISSMTSGGMEGWPAGRTSACDLRSRGTTRHKARHTLSTRNDPGTPNKPRSPNARRARQ